MRNRRRFSLEFKRQVVEDRRADARGKLARSSFYHKPKDKTEEE